MTGVPVRPQDRNRFLIVDVTGLVQAWLDHTLENNGLVLTANAAGVSVEFDSTENTGTSHEPELEITLGSTGPQGPPVTAGARTASLQAGAWSRHRAPVPAAPEAKRATLDYPVARDTSSSSGEGDHPSVEVTQAELGTVAGARGRGSTAWPLGPARR